MLTGWDEYEVLFMESFLRDEQIPNFDPSMGLPDGYWIGLQKKEWRKGKGPYWGWVDQWPLSYTRWGVMMPTDMKGDCAFMHTNGGWANEDCGMTKPFVCKAEFYDWTPDYTDIDNKLGPVLPCELGWVLHGHHCVKVFTDKQSWENAEGSCNYHQSNLVSIHSENYNQWLRGLFQNVTSGIPSADWEGYWTGMRWTGNGWGWSDGSTIKYYNWRQGEPNNWGGQVEDCVEALNDGQWNDELCNQTVPYICKKPAQTEYCAAATTSGKMKRLSNNHNM